MKLFSGLRQGVVWVGSLIGDLKISWSLLILFRNIDSPWCEPYNKVKCDVDPFVYQVVTWDMEFCNSIYKTWIFLAEWITKCWLVGPIISDKLVKENHFKTSSRNKVSFDNRERKGRSSKTPIPISRDTYKIEKFLTSWKKISSPLASEQWLHRPKHRPTSNWWNIV